MTNIFFVMLLCAATRRPPFAQCARGAKAAPLRGRFWRNCLAGAYTDYAKPAYRAGRLGLAYADTLRALVLSPAGRGRLCLGLFRDFLLKRPV